MKLPKFNLSGTGQGADNTSSFINSFFPNYMASKDRITARKDKERSRQKLSEIFGGELPQSLQGMENIPLDQALGIIPAMGNLAYKQEMADVNRGRLAAVEQAAPIAQSQAERGLDIKTEQVQTEKQMAEAKLKEENRRRIKEEDIAEQELSAKQLRADREEAASLYDLAADKTKGHVERRTARVKADMIAKKRGWVIRKDGVFTKAGNILFDFVVGGPDIPESETSNIQEVGSQLNSVAKEATGGVRKVTPEKITITNKQGVQESRYFVGEQETDANGNPIR